MKRILSVSAIWIIVCILVSSYVTAQTQSTNIIVRAKSKDAKFIGTSMGGALITIRNTETGELLAKGRTEGSTGDTQKLVRDPRERYGQISTPGAARFETSLQLSEPVFVTVKATAPYAKKQARVSTATQLWLIPGKDILGDGIVLEIPGFVVDVLNPQTHETLEGRQINIRANIVMMCGCPTSEGGLWDSSEYEIKALIEKDGETVDAVPLEFTGKTSTYEGTYNASGPGTFAITAYAYHDKTGNTGVDKTTVIVR